MRGYRSPLLDGPDPIAAQLKRAQERGQRITPWIRWAMRQWEARKVRAPNTGINKGLNPKGVTCLELGLVPIPCDCAQCKTPSLIFPAEDGADQGYCICPNCSLPKQGAAQA